jgi:hypothetical protein
MMPIGYELVIDAARRLSRKKWLSANFCDFAILVFGRETVNTVHEMNTVHRISHEYDIVHTTGLSRYV